MKVVCPGCSTASYHARIQRDASMFCPDCDYPLFWDPSLVGSNAGGTGTSGDTLRRLPGTSGRPAGSSLACPKCDAENYVTAEICIRCGADLRPAPVVAPRPLPPPRPPALPAEPEPPQQRRVEWWWIPIALALIAVVVVLAIANA
jgi:hypothetical protein